MFGRISRIHRVTDDTWLRHANPYSGWLRIATGFPCLILAVWSRVWIGWWFLLPLAVFAVWIYLNPRIFTPIKEPSQWISKGVLGERIIAEGISFQAKHRLPIWVLSVASGVFGIILLVGLYLLDVGLTLVGAGFALTFKMWFLDRAVWIYEEEVRANRRVQSWTKTGPVPE